MIYDAGGGPGVDGLTFDAIAAEQLQMYRRTIGNLSSVMVKNAEQELRQLKISEQLVHISVQVSREDFPAVRAQIELSFYPSAAQQVWGQFMSDICKKLHIEFVHSVLERGDKACIHRILRLRDGGDYLVRQRENSAVLEVLNSGAPPMDSSWAIASLIVGAKKDLELGRRNLPAVHSRIRHLVSQRCTSLAEKEITDRILAARQPVEVVTTLCLLYFDDKEVSPEELSLAAHSTRFRDIAKFTDKIDILSLHRLGLEALNRFAVGGQEGKVVSQGMTYVLRVTDQLMGEGEGDGIDVVVMGLRVMSDVMHLLASHREAVLKVILKALASYAPPAPAHRNSTRHPAGGAGMHEPRLSHSTPSTSSVAPRSSSSSLPAPHLRGGVVTLTRYDTQYATQADKARYAARAQGVAGYIKTLGPVTTPSEVKPATPKEVVKSEVVETVKPNLLLRGRERVDHSAARQALAVAARPRTAEEVPAAVAHTAAPAMASVASTGLPLPLPRLPAAHQEAMSDPSSVPRPRPAAFKIRDRPKGAGDAADEEVRWRGSKGVQGREAVEKRAAAAIRGADAERSLGLEPSPSPSEMIKLPVLAAAVVSSPAPAAPLPSSALLAPAADAPSAVHKAEEEMASVANWVPSAATRKKKAVLVLEKLPEVACGTFKGFAGQMQANVVLTQAFATLLRMLLVSYANRDYAFKKSVLEAAANVALVCAAMPKVLEYFVVVVSTMYADGFGDPTDDQASQTMQTDDPTMVVSVTASASIMPSQDGRVVEMVSELSVPSFDPDSAGRMALPVRPLLEVPDAEDGDGAASAHTSKAVVPEDPSAAGKDGEQLAAEQAAADKKAADDKAEIARLLVERYQRTPSEVVIMALAMCAAHVEVGQRERDKAAVWLETWNNNSREFKMAVLKGRNLCGL